MYCMNVIEWFYVCYKIWKINKKSDILPPNVYKKKFIGNEKDKKINCGPYIIRKNLRRSDYYPSGLKGSITKFELWSDRGSGSRNREGQLSQIKARWLQDTEWFIFFKQCSGSRSTCFEPPGSGFTSQRYGSFCHQAKIVRKTLIPADLWLLLDFLLWKMM